MSRLYRLALAAGALGLVATVIGFVVDPRQTYFSYLTAFMYVLSVALGSLCWVLSLQASSAKWVVVVRRFLEVNGASALLFAVLFIPVAVGVKQLYPWVAPDPANGKHFIELMHHKARWLNVPFFLVRAAVYFAVWAVLGNLMLIWSRRQDASRALALTLSMRRLGAGSLPLFAFTLAFASFDWIMSLQPTWYSTIFGVYYFAGGFMAAMAVLILIVTAADRAGLLQGMVNASHYHSMGKWLFAFTCFWAYIGFSQFMLIWIANLPGEIEYYLLRWERGYFPVFVFLIVGHFALPFFVMLSRELKRDPRRLSLMAIYLLVCHWVDLYWMVMPYKGHGMLIHWQDLASLVALGGPAVAFALFRLRRVAPVPIGDPYLAESIAYHK